MENFNIDFWRSKNTKYNSQWLFPIRVAAKDRIQWYSNIVEMAAALQKPLYYDGWQSLLRQNRIQAYDDTDNRLLAQWWEEGWQHTPRLAAEDRSRRNPIFHIGDGPLGETLEVIYPSIDHAAAATNLTETTIRKSCIGAPTRVAVEGRFWCGYDLSTSQVEHWKYDKRAWTLFAPDNTILGHYHNREELAQDTPYSWQYVWRQHLNNYNELENGMWVWNDNWGIMPISPKDEPLGLDWRTKYARKDDPQSTGDLDFD